MMPDPYVYIIYTLLATAVHEPSYESFRRLLLEKRVKSFPLLILTHVVKQKIGLRTVRIKFGAEHHHSINAEPNPEVLASPSISIKPIYTNSGYFKKGLVRGCLTLKQQSGVELISLSLNEEEESRFTEFLEDGKGRNLASANNTLIMRAIATGRSESVARDLRMGNGQNIDGVNWNILRGGMRKS